MKISAVDRCGCLIQSTSLESASLEPTFRPSRPYTAPFPRTIGRDSNLRIQSVRAECRHFSCPAALSALGPVPFQRPTLSDATRGFARRLRLPSALTLFPSRESLRRKRFAAEGYSYRFPGAFRPFQPFPISPFRSLVTFSFLPLFDHEPRRELFRKIVRYSLLVTPVPATMRWEIEPSTLLATVSSSIVRLFVASARPASRNLGTVLVKSR